MHEEDTVLIDDITSPEPTVSPELTVSPESTVSPEPIVSPEVTVSPGPTVSPGATVSPVPTVSPGATVLPGETVVVPQAPTALDYDVVYSAVYDAVMASELESETVSDGQTVNSTALSYFEGILGNLSPFTDYVVYAGEKYTYWNGNNERTAYEYCMVYGDLELDGTVFSGTDVSIVRMRTTGDVSVSFEHNQNVYVAAPQYYSRSNLGDYSGIIRQDWTGFSVLVLLVLGGLIWFIGKIMCLRR